MKLGSPPALHQVRGGPERLPCHRQMPKTGNLRYADDTTLMAESEEELKSLLMKVKEESKKVGLMKS